MCGIFWKGCALRAWRAVKEPRGRSGWSSGTPSEEGGHTCDSRMGAAWRSSITCSPWVLLALTSLVDKSVFSSLVVNVVVIRYGRRVICIQSAPFSGVTWQATSTLPRAITLHDKIASEILKLLKFPETRTMSRNSTLLQTITFLTRTSSTNR